LKREYCRRCADKYANPNRNAYAFHFAVSEHPGLFWGSTEELRAIGMWSYSNTDGLTRDHRVPVTEAIKHGYEPFYIRHPLNCTFMPWRTNNRKKGKSSISYTRLVAIVDAYELARSTGTEIDPYELAKATCADVGPCEFD
jgi:hypothetical protein